MGKCLSEKKNGNKEFASKNEIRRKHKLKQNRPSILPFWKTVWAQGNWIQCFHWPNITTGGKYPCACVMPERCFVFT